MYGTKVDGEPLVNEESKVLDGTEHSFNLGRYQPAFTVSWRPVIFSFALPSRDKKEKKITAHRQSKVEKYDMKTLESLIPFTTHVIAAKRNTSIGLQALINGRYIVTEDYLNAVAKACEPTDEGKSPLEEDFEKYWPHELEYLPPTSSEPNPRGKEWFAPKPERLTVFDGWTMIFCEKVQYENFIGPITDGGGKLERFDLIPGQTTARELVDFVEKRDKGSTAVVRFRGKGDTEQWCAELSTQVSEM